MWPLRSRFANLSQSCRELCFALRDRRLKLVSHFELVFENVIEEFAELCLFPQGEIADCVCDFSERAHKSKLKDLPLRSSVGRRGDVSMTSVHLAPMTEGEESYFVRREVELVNDAVIPDAQPESGFAGQAGMLERVESKREIVDLRSNPSARLRWKFEKVFVERFRGDLRRSA